MMGKRFLTSCSWGAIALGMVLQYGISPLTAQEPPSEAAKSAAAAPAVHLSGFLDPPPVLKPGKQEGNYVFIKEGVNFASYHKVLLEPVVFFFKDDAKYKGIHADELKGLSDAFNKAFAEALGTAYPLTDKPGPGVLLLRPALTDLVPNHPERGVAMAIIPGGSLAYAVLPDKYNNIGSASMEAELLDSMTGERLAAAVVHRVGKKTEVMKGMETWGHVKKAFSAWAHDFRVWLDETHGITAPGKDKKDKESTPEKKP